MVKGSFRVSRLHDDGTDAEHGTIPNSYRAFQYVQNQGLGGCGPPEGVVHDSSRVPLLAVHVVLLIFRNGR